MHRLQADRQVERITRLCLVLTAHARFVATFGRCASRRACVMLSAARAQGGILASWRRPAAANSVRRLLKIAASKWDGKASRARIEEELRREGHKVVAFRGIDPPTR